MHVYRGLIPFVVLQLIGLVVISLVPSLTT